MLQGLSVCRIHAASLCGCHIEGSFHPICLQRISTHIQSMSWVDSQSKSIRRKCTGSQICQQTLQNFFICSLMCSACSFAFTSVICLNFRLRKLFHDHYALKSNTSLLLGCSGKKLEFMMEGRKIRSNVLWADSRDFKQVWRFWRAMLS